MVELMNSPTMLLKLAGISVDSKRESRRVFSCIDEREEVNELLHARLNVPDGATERDHSLGRDASAPRHS